MNPKKWKTAEEVERELENDPAYLKMVAENTKKREEAYASYQDATKGVLGDLKAVGYEVNSIGELRQNFLHDHKPYKEAIPILMKWLPLITYDALKEDIVRTLSVPWAKPLATPLMVQEFVKAPGSIDTPPSSLRWAIGNALEVLADDKFCDDLVRIATNRSYGVDRQMVVLALGRMKNPVAVDVLIQLLNDADVAGHALMALGKLKSSKALPYIEPFLQHSKPWFRKEAKKAIKSINRANLLK